jgi:hypothetical protein
MSSSSVTWWRPLARADRNAVLLLVLVPIVLFGVPAIFGHPAIAADNLIQNFPLRVLSGQQIRSGHLPLLNPLANSTTPLLGGMNAGALFPTTLLFVFLPPILAWVLNLVAVYAAAALGMFALLRWHRLATLSASVAALVFAYTGAMIGQMVHLGVIQGFALLPWATLAMLSMARVLGSLSFEATWRQRARAIAPGVMATALLWGLVCLSGEPRAIAEIELLTMIIVLMVVLVRSSYQPARWRERLVYLAGVVIGVMWGVVIGLVQLLPGWNFIAQSQRASISYWFFGAGSLVVRWTSMLFVQTIVGGNAVLGQPHFFTGYNLPEVTGYVGILALVAVAAFISRLTWRGWRGENRDFVVYLALIVVGLLATWGSFTPLGHVFQQIPLFGSTRLQSRNIVLLDFGATALLGWWLNRLQESDLAGAGLVGRRRALTVAPAVVTIALSAAMMAWGVSIARWLGATASASLMARHETLTLALQVLIAGSLAFLVLGAPRIRHLTRWFCAVAAFDVAVFMIFCSTGFSPGRVEVMPAKEKALSELGSAGRFALVDPSGSHAEVFEALGLPNMNVFTKLPSVQGYGSLINSLYGDVTDVHPLFSIAPCRVAQGTFKQLRLATVVVAADVLATPVTSSTPHPTWCFPPEMTNTASRYFGQLLRVKAVALVGVGGATVSSGPVQAQLFDAKGEPQGPVIIKTGQPSMNFDFGPFHETAAGVRFTAGSGELIYSTTVSQMDSKPSFRLDNGFQEAFTTSWWRAGQTRGTLTTFRANRVRPSAWLGTNAGTSKVVSLRDASWGDSWITVEATHDTVLKRSAEWLPGWRATAVDETTGSVRRLVVERSGLIQQVIVPAGRWRVHFHYHAPYIELGVLSSSAGALALFALFGYLRGWFRRNRDGKVHP